MSEWSKKGGSLLGGSVSVSGAGRALSRGGRPLQQHERRDEEGFGDHDEVVGITSSLGAFDAGQHGVGHRVAEGGHPASQLPL